jgi:hypothetical protein
LRAFFEANAANAFYFYSPFETSPPFSRTPAGTEGRYVVRFASDYDQTISMVRSDIPTQLIEISDTTDAPINPGGGGGNPPPVNVPNGAVLSLVTAHTPNGGYTPVFGAIASLDGVSTLSPRPTIFQDNSTYAKRTDTVLIDPNVVIGGALFVLFGLEEDTNHGSSVLSPADTMLVYDAFVTLTYTDGSVFVYRPSGFATQIAQSPATAGAVTGGANAIDTDPNTFATITVTQYTSGLSGAFLSVTNFRRTT